MIDLTKYFLFPEGKALVGRYGKNLIILTSIVFIALLAIGVANSSQIYLKKKMDSPFVKFVDVPIGRSSKVEINYFKKKSIESKYSYNNVEAISQLFLGFLNVENIEKNATVEVISTESEVFKKVLNKKPLLVSNTNIFSDNDVNCILSRDYLLKLGYDDFNIPFINYYDYSTGDIIPIKVSAVVSQLPRYADILISEKFIELRQRGLLNSTLEEKDNIRFYIPDITEISKKLIKLKYRQVKDEPFLNGHGIIIENNNIQSIGDLSNKIIKIKVLYPEAIRIFNFNKIQADQEYYLPKPKFFTFSFTELNNILSFKEYLYNDFDLKIDMNTIESKENYDFFNKISSLLAMGLILFSVFIIIIFTSNLILNHISKNERSLGTLKAFGFENNKVVLIYVIISLILVTISFIVSYTACHFVGKKIMLGLINLFNITIHEDIIYYNIALIKLILAFIITPSLIIMISIMYKLKGKTPGDLIYNR